MLVNHKVYLPLYGEYDGINLQESQKQALAESTGLDLKQINNWFINQRKRHWKPSEDMQFAVMDATNYYMENVMCKPFPMDGMPMLL